MYLIRATAAFTSASVPVKDAKRSEAPCPALNSSPFLRRVGAVRMPIDTKKLLFKLVAPAQLLYMPFPDLDPQITVVCLLL